MVQGGRSGRFSAPRWACSCLAARLPAQTLPVPALPPPARTEPVSAREVAADSTRPRPWEYALGVGVGWDGNIDFLVPDGPSGFAVVPRGGLARIFSSPRSQLRATAAGSLDRAIPAERAAPVPGRRRAGGRLPAVPGHVVAGQRFVRARLQRLVLASSCSEQGVPLPVVKTRSFAGALGLSTKAGSRTSLRFDGRFHGTEFDSPLLIDGASVRGSVGLQRQLGDRSTAAIEYSLEYVRPDQAGTSHVTHFGSLQWTRVLSQRSALLLEGGGSYTPDAARAGLDRKESFFGGASVTRQVRRSSLTLFVRREVAPAFGTGVSRLELRTGIRGSIPMGRDWELRMLASHVRPENQGDAEAAQASSGDAFVALGRRLGRRLEVSGEARYRRRGAMGALPAVEAFQAGLFLTLLTSHGRPIRTGPGL